MIDARMDHFALWFLVGAVMGVPCGYILLAVYYVVADWRVARRVRRAQGRW